MNKAQLTDFAGLSFPIHTYNLYLTDFVCIECTGKIPNKFHTFMMRIFFGFKVKPIYLTPVFNENKEQNK
jgi:hypothetical protein